MTTTTATTLSRQREAPGFWTEDRVRKAMAEAGSRYKLQRASQSAYAAAQRLGILDELPVIGTGNTNGRAPKYTEQWLRDTLKTNPQVKNSTELRKLNQSAYQSLYAKPFYKAVLTELGITINTNRRGFWTEKRIVDTIASHGWTTVTQMRRDPVGKNIADTCYNRGLRHLLPRLAETASDKDKDKDKQDLSIGDEHRLRRKAPSVPVNCWPFQGAATPADTTVE